MREPKPNSTIPVPPGSPFSAPLRLCLRLFSALIPLVALNGALGADTTAVVINGLGGLPEYEENFLKWSKGLEEAFQDDASAKVVRLDGREVRKDAILAALERVARNHSQEDELWLFLVGHANVNRDRYKFNIKGPDLTDREIADFLGSLPGGRAYVVVGTNSSGGLAAALSGPDRVVVTATRSAREKYPPLFLSFFLESTDSAEADVDKNGKVSLLEAYRFARRKVEGWFEEEGRIQTEHPLLADQSGPVLGAKKEDEEERARPQASGANLLASMAYLSQPPEQAYRTAEARKLAEKKKEVERKIEALKFRKAQLSESDYFQQLESLLVELARINKRISELEGESRETDSNTDREGPGGLR